MNSFSLTYPKSPMRTDRSKLLEFSIKFESSRNLNNLTQPVMRTARTHKFKLWDKLRERLFASESLLSKAPVDLAPTPLDELQEKRTTII